MKNIKDKKIIAVAVLLVVFTIGYFLTINKVSYAFEDDYDYEASYNMTIDIIKEAALAYGEKNTDDFNEEGLLYIDVQTLIDNSYLAGDNNGNVVGDAKSNEVLNEKKIRLKYDGQELTAEVYS